MLEAGGVSMLSAVAQPRLLGLVGGQGDNDAGEDGAAERGAPAARSGNDLLSTAPPVCRAHPQRACEVGEDVEDHQYPQTAKMAACRLSSSPPPCPTMISTTPLP